MKPQEKLKVDIKNALLDSDLDKDKFRNNPSLPESVEQILPSITNEVQPRDKKDA